MIRAVPVNPATEAIVHLFKRDAYTRKHLAELLAPKPYARLVSINAMPGALRSDYMMR
ncbi:hypothetical protein Pyrfu_0420 [Pyrolobus fumarii 1A]|uniref:Uncharacterized protein n=1 Tax=Pyrolobus fumarii (strain DSM 11204 / 1A) TaxID=694429 RepID=G0EG43_PYRF1|nr:hypothetical protein [Pyrolobus fumarii]AEM38291.1 hypothetical protein Pyrfu_0420 [Pyrolobus fumarii 1A]